MLERKHLLLSYGWLEGSGRAGGASSRTAGPDMVLLSLVFGAKICL